VRWLLAWRPSALAAHRARLLTVVATLACMRVNEAWLPPGYEPGAYGVALLPSSKKGALRALGILDRRRDPMVAAERNGGAAAGAHTHARAITARTGQSRRARRTRRARHDHGMHGACTAHTPRSRHARFGHGTRCGHGERTSATARTLWSLCALRSRHARLDRCTHGAARQALWTQRARRPRQRD
jgi:hypothetical protein